MSDGKKYYCFCGSNCKYETMTKEQILTAIAQAVSTGSVGDCDTGFITKVKEKNGGKAVSFWVGTQYQYNALAEKDENCMYIITDDTSAADLKNTVEQMAAECTASAAAAAESAAAAAAAAECAFTQEAVGVSQYWRKYNNGIAEGWARYQMIGKIQNQSGAMFVSNPFNFTPPEFIVGTADADILVYEVSPTFAVNAPAPVTLMQYPPETEGGVRRHVFASTAACDSVEIICTGHYVWRWKDIDGTSSAQTAAVMEV